MRKFAAALIGLVLVVALAPQAFAKTETVTGQLIDLACYVLDKGDTGNTHRGRGYNCGRACAKEGFSVGLLTTDGKLYEVAGDLTANKNVKLVPHIGHTVTITGDASENNGRMMISASDLKMVSK